MGREEEERWGEEGRRRKEEIGGEGERREGEKEEEILLNFRSGCEQLCG